LPQKTLTERELQMRRWANVLTAVAAFSGAAGVMEAATAAHAMTEPLLQTSANFLMLMAAAAIAINAFALSAQRHRGWFLIAASILLGGCLLFCGDLTVRVFLAHKLFAFAAPIGGSLMIVGWIAAALVALSSCFGGSRS
jgi:uncharacterized membrane protein YgdD (TMEM256/DUF423 family)